MSDERMKRVAIESPFAPPRTVDASERRAYSAQNIRYALACLRFVLASGCSPYASHLIFTMVLRDTTPEERRLGMHAGFAYADTADERWVFTDMGISSGMKAGETRAEKLGQPCKRVELGADWAQRFTADIPDSVIEALVRVMVDR